MIVLIGSVLGETIRHMFEGLLDSHSNLLLMLKDLPPEEEASLVKVFKENQIFFQINNKHGTALQDLNIKHKNGTLNFEELRSYIEV